MEILRKEIPLLEFDGNPAAVLQPDFPTSEAKLPRRAVFAFLGETVDAFVRERQLPLLAEYEMITGNMPVYGMEVQGETIALAKAPLGAPAAVMLLDWMFAHGTELAVACGSCGALTAMPENAFLIPTRALRDEGTSYRYLPAAREIGLDAAAQSAVRETLHARGVPAQDVTVWTTDAFYRETPALIQARVAEGCTAVDMECAALAACAAMRGRIFGQLLFTADSLANLDTYQPRGWGGDAMRFSLELAADAVMRV